MTKCVHKHTWLSKGKPEIHRSRQGKRGFSHNEELPLGVNVKHLSWCKRAVRIKTLEEVWYQDAVLVITIPPGFVCDLASVPRPLWLAVSPFDIALEALFHDLNYREQEVSRQFADFLLREMMRMRGVPFYIRWPVYLAVRLFGRKPWNQHQRRIAAERRKKPLNGDPD